MMQPTATAQGPSSTVIAMARSARAPGVKAALGTIDPLVTPVLDPFVDGLMEPFNEVHHTRRDVKHTLSSTNTAYYTLLQFMRS